MSFTAAFDDPRCLPVVRGWLREVLSDGDELLDAELAGTELVSNALDHAEGPREIRMRVDAAGELTVEVDDGSPDSELTVGRSRYGTYRGRGLALIDAVSRWGVRRRDGGKTVWAVLGVESAAPAPRNHRELTPASRGPGPADPHAERPLPELRASVDSLAGGRVVRVDLVGEIDLADSASLETYLRSVTVTRPEHLVVDVAGVTFLSSAGFGAFVNANYQRNGIHGALHLTGVDGNRRMQRLLLITGMRDHIDVLETADDVAALVR